MSTNERLELREEYRPFFRELRQRVDGVVGDASATLVVGIAGESGSGKSVTARGLEREIAGSGRRVVVLHQDDYFLLPPRTNHLHRCESLDNVGPHEVNLALMQSHIADFRARRDDVTAPLVDYPGNRFTTRVLAFAEADVLVVEGTYALMLDDIDVRIFLAATYEDTRERRRARNRDIDAPIIDKVLAIEHRLIAGQVARAHIVIDRTFRLQGP